MRCLPNSAEPNAEIVSTNAKNGGGSERMSKRVRDTPAAINFDLSVAEEQTDGTTSMVKHSGTKSVYQQIRRFLNDRVSGSSVLPAVNNFTIQPSEAFFPITKTQHEKEASHKAIGTTNFITSEENFQLATEAQGTKQTSNFQLVPKPVIGDPKEPEEMQLTEKLDEETSSQGGNKNAASNTINDGPEEHSSNGVLGRGLPQKTTSLNFTEIAERMVNDELDDEVDSFAADTTLVLVRSYKIKPKYEVLVGDILSKFGDIAANCNLGSVAFRSFCMEHVCEIIQKLIDTNIGALKETDLEEMMSCVIDLKNANIDIGWLKMRLDEISEAKFAIQQLRKHHQAAFRKSDLQKMNNLLEVYTRKKAVKQAELKDIENKIYDVKCNISAAEDDYKKVEKVILESKAKLRHIVELGSLVSGLIEI